MPCQEPPVAMSTWQASIHVPKDCVVLMSGNPVGEEVASRHERQGNEQENSVLTVSLPSSKSRFSKLFEEK